MASKIQWTTETWNPLRANRNLSTDPTYEDSRGMEVLGIDGWHCERVSAGCINCYAETQNESGFRGGTKLPYNRASRDKVETFLHKTVLAKPLHWTKPRMVFVCSMTDIFGEWVPDEDLDQIFAIFALTPHITYQVLTKRSERMQEYMTEGRRFAVLAAANQIRPQSPPRHWYHAPRGLAWPLPNVWLGVSVENNDATPRIEKLRSTPAAVRWLSVEPLLERFLIPNLSDRIDWVVVGGESGSKLRARQLDLAWVRTIVNQCRGAHVPVFVKQLGTKPVISTYSSAIRSENYLRLNDWKGGDISEWPADLQIREFPHAT